MAAVVLAMRILLLLRPRRCHGIYEVAWPREEVVPLLDDPDENTALTSSCILSGAGHEDAMITALGSRHVSVRRVALDYLVEKGGDAAARGLVIAIKDSDPGIRHLALDRLTGIGKAVCPD